MLIPFYLAYTDYLSWLNNNFASLTLSDDIKFLSWIIINIATLYFIIVLLKFVKALVYFAWDKVFK